MAWESKVREQVISMGADNITVKRIQEVTKVPRPTILHWLSAAGIEPTYDRATPKRERATSLGNLPLALEINRNVQRRIEEQDELAAGDGAESDVTT